MGSRGRLEASFSHRRPKCNRRDAITPRNGARMVIRDFEYWMGTGNRVCGGLSPQGGEKGQALHCDLQ